MVASVYHRLAADVFADADRLDREYITRWFMAFASKKPLEIEHPRTGRFHVGGFAFGGDLVIRYDQFTRTIIDDFVERHLRACEDGLEAVPDAKLGAAVPEFAGMIFSAATRLSDRQGKLKRRLLRGSGSDWAPLFEHGMDSMMSRLATKVDELRVLRGAAGVSNTVVIGANFGAVQVGTVASSQTQRTITHDPADLGEN
ncbi:MAG: hypothetical protein R3C27_12945 [Hyphomonadaceae bacterium]